MNDNTFQSGQPSSTEYLPVDGGLYNGPDIPYDNAQSTADVSQNISQSLTRHLTRCLIPHLTVCHFIDLCLRYR